MTARCIICDQHNPMSREHIIPEALGNRSFVTNCICVDCNNKLGRNVDSYLGNHLSVKEWKQLYGIPSADGSPVYAFDGLQTERDGIKYVIRNGVSEIIPIPRTTETGLSITALKKDYNCVQNLMIRKLLRTKKNNGSFFTKEEAEHLVRNADIISKKIEPVTYEFSGEVDLVKFAMAYIKIAFEFSFLVLGDRYRSDPECEVLKGFLQKGLELDHKHIREAVTFQDISSVIEFGDVEFPRKLFLICQKSFSLKIIHILTLMTNQNTIWCQIALCNQPIIPAIVKISDCATLYQDVISRFPSAFVFIDGSYKIACLDEVFSYRNSDIQE